MGNPSWISMESPVMEVSLDSVIKCMRFSFPECADAAPTTGTSGPETAGNGTSTAAAATAIPAAPIVSPDMADRLAAAMDKSSALYRAAVKIQARYGGWLVAVVQLLLMARPESGYSALLLCGHNVHERLKAW